MEGKVILYYMLIWLLSATIVYFLIGVIYTRGVMQYLPAYMKHSGAVVGRKKLIAAYLWGIFTWPHYALHTSFKKGRHER